MKRGDAGGFPGDAGNESAASRVELRVQNVSVPAMVTGNRANAHGGPAPRPADVDPAKRNDAVNREGRLAPRRVPLSPRQ